MRAAQQKRRPDAQTSGAADHEGAEPEDNNTPSEKASGRKSDPFALFKWLWLDQVASDPTLPPAAYRVAIRIAGQHLNRKTGEAWPGIERLAADLTIKSANTVRTAIKAMAAAGHMAVKWSAGGKKQTNHFRPLVAGIPFKNLKGMEGSNPSNIGGDTPQNRDAKPFKDLKGNPFSEPYDEPRRAQSAPADGNQSDQYRDAHLTGASDPVIYQVGQSISLPNIGQCTVIRRGTTIATNRADQKLKIGLLLVRPPSGVDFACPVMIEDGQEALRPHLMKRWDEMTDESRKRVRWERKEANRASA